MRILFTIFIAVIAFAAGVWYMGGFDTAPQFPGPDMDTPATNTPSTDTPATSTAAVQATYHNADADKIQVSTPKPGAMLASTFTVSGKAVGNWYFEASFPLEVLDANGTSLKMMPVQAQGDWMTSAFVPFSVEVSVPNYHGKATLILHNDNPSGMPENEASISIPITIQ
ncbi:hypothetical protein A2765_04580 [Candidatus Kaiserbacteria bacterium RIFCSPHIGHO2_01_FULL_56_24]|uniref:Bacterial spore germination immunoglobulin-like domain-containing protein n=1 Tax=Candidatus Kaiserbacteria bacterium RIFCSPHIGHO2_01_FULL_56_24 TaxID=1798487 RepID=A0A1F6DEI2_9BACT|nr:MAG: hypothetical protein A2765_04580 [Candidatus Kaiserbacteria bacterium RIFCSPHIGHO2_01_FULL_56_24]